MIGVFTPLVTLYYIEEFSSISTGKLKTMIIVKKNSMYVQSFPNSFQSDH